MLCQASGAASSGSFVASPASILVFTNWKKKQKPSHPLLGCDQVTTAASEGSLPLCLDRFLVFSGSVSEAVIHLHREARSNQFVSIWPSLSTKWSHLNCRTRGCFFQPQSRQQLTAASAAAAGHAHAKTQPSPCLTADVNTFQSQTVFIYLLFFCSMHIPSPNICFF